MDILVLLPILTPLLTAVACLLLWNQPFWQRTASVLGAAGLAVSSGTLLYAVATHGIQVTQLGSWPAPFGITLVADLFSAIMATVAGVIGFAVLVYALAGVDEGRQRFGFHPLFHTLLLGVSGAFLTGDIFNMYVWFEVMLISSFVLLSLGGEKAQLEGAFKYVTLNLISSGFFLAATGVLYGAAGTLNLADLAEQAQSEELSGAASIAGGMLLMAFGIKAAVFPLFFWLPAAYHTPPAAIAAVMAGLLTKVGVYAIARVISLVFVNSFVFIQPVLLIVAGATMITGVLGAAAQVECKRILSYHIISQIGYMIMGLAIFTPLALAGAVFYLVHHIIVKTNLFLVAGIVNRLEGTDRLANLGGLYRRRAWLAALFLIPALSLAGIPPLSGFWAKFALLRAGLDSEHYLLIATALIVSLLTLFSMTKIWAEAFWKEPQPSPEPSSTSRGALLTMAAPSLALGSLTVAIGLCAEPLFQLSTSAAEQLLDPSRYIDAVLNGA